MKEEHSIYLFDWVMGGWTLQNFQLPESRTALVNRIVVIGPPEMIEDLDPVSKNSRHLFRGLVKMA